MTYTPEGYPRLSPYLVVNGAAATIDFAVKALGGLEMRRFEAGPGKIAHAEVRFDDSVLMVSDAQDGWPAAEAQVHLYVPDVDEVYKRALALGATSVQEPQQRNDDDKRGGVKDASGTTWWIATRVS